MCEDEKQIMTEAIQGASEIARTLSSQVVVSSAILRLLLYDHLRTRANPLEAVTRYRDYLLNLFSEGQPDG
jgi:hypothetical protein